MATTPARRGDLVVLVEETSVTYQDRMAMVTSERVTIGLVAGADKTGLVSAVLDCYGVKVKVRATPKALPRYSKTLLVSKKRVDAVRCHRVAGSRMFESVEAAAAFVKGYLLPEPLMLPL
jgi:hypothetical protein